MNKVFLTYLFAVLPFLGGSLYAQNVPTSRSTDALKSDTAEVEDNPWAIEHDSKYTPTDSARLRGEIDNIIYVMDRRHLYEGDDTLRHWYDNLYFQVGMGLDKMLLQTDDYTFHQFTNLHAGLGIQLNKYHSLRGTLEGAFGYKKYQTNLMLRGEAKLDHLFDLTSYFDGYRPNRLLSISSVLGGGLMYSVYHPKSNTGSKRKGLGAEIHGGVQFRFYTGPHGYMNFEPYIGFGPDRIDLSKTSWRKLDVFYGANINYVYYFTNHLSRAARMRLLSEMDERQKFEFTTVDDITKDTLLQSWACPWFFEVAVGPVALVKDDMGVKENLKHMGHNISLSLGKWLSPVIGFRGTLSERMAIYRVKNNYNKYFQKEFGNHYISARLDAMFNPFGFSKDFDWNAKYGVYGMVGFELGWISFNQFENTGKALRTYSQAYSLAAHGWVKISDGLQFFVEPRVVGHMYKVPYKNVDWMHMYTRKAFMVNVGLTATGLSPKYRKPTVVDSFAIDNHHWTVGAGFGTNMIQKFSRLVDDDSFPYNFNVFAQYHLNKVSAIRLGFEYFVHSASDYGRYSIYNTSQGKTISTTNRMMNFTYKLGIVSLDYSMNLSNLMFGYSPTRKFDFEAFAGPSLAFYFGENIKLSDKYNITMQDDWVSVWPNLKHKSAYPAANGGVKVSYQVNDKLGIHLTPQIIYIPQLDLKGIDVTKASFYETLDLGVQYKF